MCLYYDYVDASILFKSRQLITCYKVLEVENDEWKSPCYYKIYPKCGVVKSNRGHETSLLPSESQYGIVRHGIHVYTSLSAAISDTWKYDIIVPVLCHINDFVAGDYIKEEAVFTKIRIHKRAQQYRYVVNPIQKDDASYKSKKK